MSSRKMNFVRDYSEKIKIKAIVVAVQLPSGAVEIITNYEDLENKYMYYLETYDSDMVMYKNENIRIINWMIL